MRPLAIAAVAWLLAAPALAAESTLVLETTIPLHGVSGRIDHMAVDLPRRRLMVAELGNNTVDVIDLDKRTPVHRISGLHEPQGVGYAERADTLVIANAGDGSVQVVNARDFSVSGSVKLGDDADNVRIDLRNGRTYINIPDAHQIAVVDLDARRIVATWPTHNMRGNFPMALDPSQHLIASVFRSPPMLMLLDPATGEVRQRLPTCGDADDVFFDPRRPRVYVSCGTGELAILERKNANWTMLGMIETAGGARTSLFVPELDRLFVAERAGLLGSDAAVRVYRPAP